MTWEQIFGHWESQPLRLQMGSLPITVSTQWRLSLRSQRTPHPPWGTLRSGPEPSVTSSPGVDGACKHMYTAHVCLHTYVATQRIVPGTCHCTSLMLWSFHCKFCCHFTSVDVWLRIMKKGQFQASYFGTSWFSKYLKVQSRWIEHDHSCHGENALLTRWDFGVNWNWLASQLVKIAFY